MAFYTSRSAIALWQRCKRAYYYTYIYGGQGISPSYRSVPLTTGSAVHVGVHTLMKALRDQKPLSLKAAIDSALTEYDNVCKGRELEAVRPADQEYTYLEQRCLTEQLVRAWASEELPQIAKEFTVVETEHDVKWELDHNLGIFFLSKADAILKRNDGSEDMVIYSLKTVKDDKRSMDSLGYDLQGLTESLSHQIQAIQNNATRTRLKAHYKGVYALEAKEDGEAYAQGMLAKRLETEPIPPKMNPIVMGVRFCFLVKGKRYPFPNETWESKGRRTLSPLIIGYRQETPTGFEYAWSKKIPKPENPSGFGYLGSGWQEFNLFEDLTMGPAKSVGGPKGWFKLLGSGEAQGELGNPIRQAVLVPPERLPTLPQLEMAKTQILSESKIMIGRRIKLEQGKGSLDELFPQSLGHCEYPTRCPNFYACHRASAGENLLDLGIYEPRKPHHELEEVGEEGEE